MAEGDQGGQQQGGGDQGGGLKPWYEGKADAELIGHLQNNGWDKDPVEAAIAAAKSQREAQKKLGVPPSELLRMVKPDSPEADVKAFWNKLGAPADPKEYDFTGIKYADGEAIEPEFADALLASFAKRFVPKETALEIAKDVVKFADGDQQQQAAAKTAKVEAEKATLKAEWKQNFDD